MTYREEAIEALKVAVSTEALHAQDKWPMFASAHEAYAVITEELEEVQGEWKRINKALAEYWDGVKLHDESIKTLKLAAVREIAYTLALEAVQVAAVACKAITSAELESGSERPDPDSIRKPYKE